MAAPAKSKPAAPHAAAPPSPASPYQTWLNTNAANLQRFEASLREHMTAGGTKLYHFNCGNQEPAVGFIDPASEKMVMLRSDGRFWSAWKLGDAQFQGIIDKGLLW
ncbi:hypothetical protein [Streptomyces sp. NPDC006193]|uniref:hypothetical protein n=1 Tax=Streptomyces sp. NPDC006193 TaxID=3155717 RepID=UPI0033BB274B